MKLLLFRSLWTNGFDLDAALADCAAGDFDGIEGPVPELLEEREVFSAKLRDAGVPFIAEIATGGGYVPRRDASPAEHLDEFCEKLDASLVCNPLFVTALAGCDAWSLAENVVFFRQAANLADKNGVIASFETHRSRSTFNPWTTRDLLTELPELRLTCDFSHWCCVCERLIDTEPEVLALCAVRAQHIHARVGYDQGPQVPHPAVPEYGTALEAHERWWALIWAAHAQQKRDFTTMTPEFGPDGYLQSAPFSKTPIADLDEINHWMARRQRAVFEQNQRDLCFG